MRCFARGAIEEFIFAVVRALQVNQATKLKSKAGRLQEMAAELLSQAKTEKEGAAALKAKYYQTMDDYGKAVQKIDDATMNAQSLTLAQVATQYGTASGHGANPGASAAVALKGQLQKAQQDLAAITSQKAKADEDTETARKLADQYQPMIIDAEKDKRSSDFKFQEFARLTQEADSLQTRADALLSRADTIDGLIQVCVRACRGVLCVTCSRDMGGERSRHLSHPIGVLLGSGVCVCKWSISTRAVGPAKAAFCCVFLDICWLLLPLACCVRVCNGMQCDCALAVAEVQTYCCR